MERITRESQENHKRITGEKIKTTNGEVNLSGGKYQQKIVDAKNDTDVWKIVKEVIQDFVCLKISTKVTGTGSADGEEICTLIDLLQAERMKSTEIF